MQKDLWRQRSVKPKRKCYSSIIRRGRGGGECQRLRAPATGVSGGSNRAGLAVQAPRAPPPSLPELGFPAPPLWPAAPPDLQFTDPRVPRPRPQLLARAAPCRPRAPASPPDLGCQPLASQRPALQLPSPQLLAPDSRCVAALCTPLARLLRLPSTLTPAWTRPRETALRSHHAPLNVTTL